MKIFLLILTIIAFFSLASCVFFTEKNYYHGNISNHFDGTKFHNLNQEGAKSFSSYHQAKKEYENQYGKTQWPTQEIAVDQIIPSEKVDNHQIISTFVGHSTFLIQVAGFNILTDPIWSNRASPVSFIGPKRIKKPGINFANLPKIDAVLISHSHYDHLDLPTIKQLKKHSNPQFFAGLGMCYFLNNIKNLKLNCTELDWGQSFTFNQNLQITFLPAKHWSKRYLFGNNATLWGAFALQTKLNNNKLAKIYFAGDTGFDSHFKEAGQQFSGFDLAFLPIGAYKPQSFMSKHHTSPEEAVNAMQQLNAKQAIAMHFETFPMASDNFSDPVIDLKKALQQQQINEKQFVALQPGQQLILP
jgi:L-ascorbate metabolism protein UlaG (beta-lactamase superfamily)